MNTGLAPQDAPALHIENLSVHYGRDQVLSGISLDIAVGEYLGIIGPNGGGKSTLLKAVLGLVPHTAGTIRLFGRPIAENRQRVGYVPQFAEMDKRFPITTREVILTAHLKRGLSPFYRFSSTEIKTADTLLDQVGIEGLARRQIASLSGGEFQKILIARALALNPLLLLLDEPTACVDATSRAQIYQLLEQLNRQMTIVLVTHDLLAISSHVRRLACLNRNLIYHGEPELAQETVNQLYGCPVDLVAHGVPHRVLRTHEGDE